MTDKTIEVGELPKTPSLHVLSNLNLEQADQVQRFRASVPGMNGKVRTPEEEAEHMERFCSDQDVKKWILAHSGGDLVGMTVLFGRDIPFKDRKVSLGGIGRVRVREDWRQKGVAKLMMSQAMIQLAEMGYDAAFLDTDMDSFLVDFYRQYGFVPLNRPYTYTGESGRRYEENNGMLASIKSPEVFQELINDPQPLDIGKGNW